MHIAEEITLDSQIADYSTGLYAKVALDIPIGNGCFYYLIPDDLINIVSVGKFVYVPFGHQELIGIVTKLSSKEEFVNDVQSAETIKIRPVYYVLNNISPFSNNFLNLAEWISNYYKANIGTVLFASVASELLEPSNHRLRLTIKLEQKEEVVSPENIILQKLKQAKNKTASLKALISRTKLKKEIFYTMVNKLIYSQLIEVEPIGIKEKLNKINKSDSGLPRDKQITLNKHQQSAFNNILDSIKSQKYQTYLLHGVTGSGKTEVYLRLIEETLKKNKSIIYLVPEIYLIHQTKERLFNRFGSDNILLWHSSLNKKEKLENCQSLFQNNSSIFKPKIILGARSAVLTALSNIGLIVIDEAHDSSYKQASPAPRYDAIKTAMKRGELENCPVVLGTATPNITDYYNSLKNNSVLELPERIDNLPMPEVNIIDLKNETLLGRKNIISKTLYHKIKTCLENKEQIILLLNRRGYSSHIFCRACGKAQHCSNCSVPVVFHKESNLLVCHHCGLAEAYEDEGSNVPAVCVHCKSQHFRHFGFGTQQLEEELKSMFPVAKILRVDRDQLQKKDNYISTWEDFAQGKSDILLGTQLVAKGLDLPNVTLVGVIMADTVFNFPDYIAHERAFQLLTQVSGRTGRGSKPGEVFIQTYDPENQIFAFVKGHNHKSFYNYEIEQRKIFLYPPFTSITRLIVQHEDEQICKDYVEQVQKEFSIANSRQPTATILGPSPCFFTKLHGKFRYHILCKTENNETFTLLFHSLLHSKLKNVKVDVIVDVDSVNLL